MSTQGDTPQTGPPSGERAIDRLLSGLAERVGARFTASTVFGTPVERDGVTVIPVAAARFGFGGGAGSGPGDAQEGSGGGGGGSATPVGYIEVKDGRSRFVPIVRPSHMLGLLCAAAIAGLLIWRPVLRERRASPRRWR